MIINAILIALFTIMYKFMSNLINVESNKKTEIMEIVGIALRELEENTSVIEKEKSRTRKKPLHNMRYIDSLAILTNLIDNDHILTKKQIEEEGMGR